MPTYGKHAKRHIYSHFHEIKVFVFIVFLLEMILKKIKTEQNFCFLFLGLNIGLKSCQSNKVDMTKLLQLNSVNKLE